MQNYVGTKFIKAEPAIRATLPGGKTVIYLLSAPVPLPQAGEKREDGYKVVYEGGYESWSPKDVFEKAYRLTDAHPGGMTEQDFASLVRRTVAQYANEHLDKTDGKQISEEDVYIVWMVKVLQNNKALASTTLFDGMYYECTYNGDKGEMYLDAYKKFENRCIQV